MGCNRTLTTDWDGQLSCDSQDLQDQREGKTPSSAPTATSPTHPSPGNPSRHFRQCRPAERRRLHQHGRRRSAAELHVHHEGHSGRELRLGCDLFLLESGCGSSESEGGFFSKHEAVFSSEGFSPGLPPRNPSDARMKERTILRHRKNRKDGCNMVRLAVDQSLRTFSSNDVTWMTYTAQP